MRKAASLRQWQTLYESATRIKERKPWEKFWDMDLIGIRYGKEEDTVFFSILGRGGGCYGVVVYEGYEGLNSFMMLTMKQEMNLSSDYAMYNQKNLACYWGNRDELTDKQRKIVKDLGYSYRGKNQWLYFLSLEPGYCPCNPDSDEVRRLGEYFQDLELALKYYDAAKMNVDFEHGNMFLLSFGKDKKNCVYREVPLPFMTFQFGNLIITDDDLLEDLSRASKSDIVLEADISIVGAKITDKKYDRPVSPALPMLCDSKSGMIINFDMSKPDDDPIVMLAEMVIDYVFKYGAPKEIRVTNIIVEAGLEQICDVCGIKLCRVKRLQALDLAVHEMKEFGL